MKRWLLPGLTLLAIIAGVMLFYQSAAISVRGGEDAPLYSIHRYDPFGTAAIKDLLSQRGTAVRALQRPSLEQDDTGVLIQVLAHEKWGFSRREVPGQTTRLLEWISQGNTLIQFTREPTLLLEKLKLTFANKINAKQLEELTDAEAHGKVPEDGEFIIVMADWNLAGELKTPTGRPITLLSPGVLTEDQGPSWRPLARLRDGGGIVAGEYKIGKGKLIVVSAPTPILNGSIGSQGNLDFILALIGEQGNQANQGNRAIIFDEWSHGVGHEATVMGFIRSAGLLPVLFQLVVLMALYTWSTSGQTQPDEPPHKRPRSSIEQIQTLGYLYGRTLTPDLAFERVYGEAQRRIAEALRCQPQEIQTQLAKLGPQSRPKSDQLVERLNRVGRGSGPRCRACGYDLTFNQSGRCPECGGIITAQMQNRINESAALTDLAERAPGRRVRIDSDLATILTLSHQLVQEAESDRRARK